MVGVAGVVVVVVVVVTVAVAVAVVLVADDEGTEFGEVVEPVRAVESNEDKPVCVCVFVSALRIPSGEISTLDRMLASGFGAAVPTAGVAFVAGG